MRIRTILYPALAAVLLLPSLLAQGISDAARAQIAEVMAVKRTFTPAMQKMDSETAFSLLKAQGRIPAWMAAAGTTDNTGFARVEIGATVTPALEAFVQSVGGRIERSSPGNDLLVAVVPSTSLEQVASRPDVRRVVAPSKMTTNGFGRALPRKMMFVGATTSQGYIAHRAADTIKTLGITGAGVKVGVLSDSASAARIAALVATGDLPADTVVLPGQEGAGSDEGTAMMEIIHDTAPGAKLYFATAFNGVQSFADNILALAAAGCKVIVDDVSYFNESVFMDGPIAQAVNIVTSQGVTYISSAGNSGSKTAGTSGAWEGDFVNGGPVSGVVGTFEGGQGSFHSFGGQLSNVLTAASTSAYALKWSDPNGASANDYDLFILDSTGTTIKRFSAASQTGTQDPVELASAANTVAGDRLVVVLYDGVARALHVNTNRGRLQINTPGVVFGHNAARNTVSTAAVFWNSARTGTKPFVGGAANRNEIFSSDGPRRIFYNPDGSPITAGNVLFATNGGEVLQKPDLAGADGVSTKTPGFGIFYGTSAAAPHLAAIAAMVLEAKPGYTPAQVKQAMIASALDNMAAGVDRDSGYGIAMALKAVQYALTH